MSWKHPRGDGEDNIVSVLPLTFTETPPWGRGRLAQWQAILEYFGNTPVGTGKTNTQKLECSVCQKHPRGDGEDLLINAFKIHSSETPPWGRGRL